MRMLASAMAAAAGLGTAAGVALVARQSDPPARRPVTADTGRPVVTPPTRTVVVISPAAKPKHKPKQPKGKGDRGQRGNGHGKGHGDGNDEGDGG